MDSKWLVILGLAGAGLLLLFKGNGKSTDSKTWVPDPSAPLTLTELPEQPFAGDPAANTGGKITPIGGTGNGNQTASSPAPAPSAGGNQAAAASGANGNSTLLLNSGVYKA